jgi:phosphoglycolate phosphatase-like HAD superfamily hydrolase
MRTNGRLAWVFDVDGTLLLTEGASREAFALAARDALDRRDDLSDIAFAGRTEPLIFTDILAKHALAVNEEGEARFWNSVFGHMRDRLAPGRGRVLPGVAPLLDAIAAEPAWIAGLLTGNMTQMARIKLGHYGLRDRFAFGAFGEQAADRGALARDLVARLERDHAIPPEHCLFVGDTEHDIACARAAGARVLAVATGSRSLAELQAFEPDLALESLADTPQVLSWARGVLTEP